MAQIKKAVQKVEVAVNTEDTKEVVNEVEVTTETPVEVEEQEDSTTDSLEVQEEKTSLEVDEAVMETATEAVQKMARIRMREDHRVWIGEDCYEFKAGQFYTVPTSLKMKLNKAGLLLPL